MKVKINGRIYHVEFETKAKSPKYGKEKRSKVLVQTECVISNGSKVILNRASATQNYRDELNWQEGRKHSLTRALNYSAFKKEARTTFWNKYKEEYPVKGK